MEQAAPPLPARPEDYWQHLYPAGTIKAGSDGAYGSVFPGMLPDGREIALPVRPLPSRPGHAVASLIVNQASFEVHDTLVRSMASLAAPYRPAAIVAVPTLGITLARGVAALLGHRRFVCLGTSRKYWYEERLSVPMRSITSPDREKTLYLDPRMVPLVTGGPVVIVDDVVSTGASLSSALDLLDRAGADVRALVCAMLQTGTWKNVLGRKPALCGVISTPLLIREGDGRWRPEDEITPE